jgi:rod shape-determining protein MreC
MATQKKNAWIFIGCTVVLALLIFFMPAYGWRVRQWLGAGNGVASLSALGTQGDDPTLAAQNETLQAEIAQLQSVATQIPQNPQNEIRAMVYLQYPFGFKNELLVNAGTNEGVATGSVVTFQGIFVGVVAQTFSDSAIVQTVFDPTFKMPVRIGSQGVDALLVGGDDPAATSISKSATVVAGDVVVTAAPGIPYGLPVGSVNATTTSADNLFQDASLNFAYDENNIQTVLIQH